MSARLLALLTFAACSPTDLVVADIPALADGGRPRPNTPCADDSDCNLGELCDKAGLRRVDGAVPAQPINCEPVRQPVCGCNGVTYWNDCLRRTSGVAPSAEGQCVSPATCSGPGTCAESRASCAQRRADAIACTSESGGTCWVLPPQCPQLDGPGSPPEWERCSNGDCFEECEAIRAQVPARPRKPGPGGCR